jgi:hypothetical protein
VANTLKSSRNGAVGFLDWLDGLRAFMLRSPLATGKRKEKDYRTHANQDDCEPNE